MSENQQNNPSKETEQSGAGPLEEVPPVVIKGGSILVRFPDVDFDDPDNQKKVKKVSHPDPKMKGRVSNVMLQ